MPYLAARCVLVAMLMASIPGVGADRPKVDGSKQLKQQQTKLGVHLHERLLKTIPNPGNPK
eukprot:2258600-Amphidinium_carterae.1